MAASTHGRRPNRPDRDQKRCPERPKSDTRTPGSGRSSRRRGANTAIRGPGDAITGRNRRPSARSKAARHRKRQEKMAADAQLPGASKVCGNSRNLPNLLTSERLVPPGTPEPLTPDSGEPSFRWRSVQHFNYEQEHVAVRAHGDIGQGLSLGPSSRQVPRRDLLRERRRLLQGRRSAESSAYLISRGRGVPNPPPRPNGRQKSDVGRASRGVKGSRGTRLSVLLDPRLGAARPTPARQARSTGSGPRFCGSVS